MDSPGPDSNPCAFFAPVGDAEREIWRVALFAGVVVLSVIVSEALISSLLHLGAPEILKLADSASWPLKGPQRLYHEAQLFAVQAVIIVTIAAFAVTAATRIFARPA